VKASTEEYPVTVYLKLQACMTGLVIKPATFTPASKSITALNYQKSVASVIDLGFTVSDGSSTDCGSRTLTVLHKDTSLARAHVTIAVDLVNSSKFIITVCPLTEAVASTNFIVRIASDVYPTVITDVDFIVDVTGDCPIT